MCAICGRRVGKRRKYCGRRCMARGQRVALSREEVVAALNAAPNWDLAASQLAVSRATLARAVHDLGVVRLAGTAHRHGVYGACHPRRARQLLLF